MIPPAVPQQGTCPNGPDEDGSWPCDPKGYFGDAECQTCGRTGSWAEISRSSPDIGTTAEDIAQLHDLISLYVPSGFADEDGVWHDEPHRKTALATLERLRVRCERVS